MNFFTCCRIYCSKDDIQSRPSRAMANEIKKRIIMRFNLVAFLLLLTIMNVSAFVHAQNISLSFDKAPLKVVLKEIKKQSGLQVLYNNVQMEMSKPVTIKFKGAILTEALKQCFKGQPLDYEIVDKTIVVKEKPAVSQPAKSIQDIQGKVVDEQGAPIPGATVTLSIAKRATATDEQGKFSFTNVNPDADEVVVVSSIGYGLVVKPLNGRAELVIEMKPAVSKLDETVVVAYGTTSQRLNTGSVAKVTAAEIQRQPVSNPLAALQGRVAGMTVVQSNGVPGSSFKVQIRGQNSLGIANSEPLFIIDGVPFAPDNSNVNTLTSVMSQAPGQGISPLNSINPNDIESIEVLKDADATAIYGSRGANGVILITTKKGKAGKTKFDIHVSQGISTPTKLVEYMNTSEYVAMRKEALANDGATPTTANAPDLVVFDQSRYSNISDLLIGNNPRMTDAQATISGGNITTQFSLSGNYHYETTPYSADLNSNRGAVHFNLSHTSADQKLKAVLSTNYTSGKSNLISSNVASGAIRLSPNTPELVDANGNLVWDYQGVAINNPLVAFLQSYSYTNANLLSNLNLGYTVLDGLTLRSSFGYNSFSIAEFNGNPSTSNNPAYGVLPYSYFGDNKFDSWIIEPQAEYTKAGKFGRMNVLIGGTWQSNKNNSATLFAYGYANDALLSSRSGATLYTPTSTDNNYKYQAGFARINYNFRDKYILNLTGRRDGSSRFGPDKRFSNFGAVGAAWIFSSEAAIKRILPFLSYGKLRGSYGITGNDQITNYQYLDSWQSSTYPYQGIAGLVPTRLLNPDYSWEENRKLEGALELGFLKDRILLSSVYFRNRSGNQLINYNLPSQTGFTAITRNFPALVQNKGWEFLLNSRNITTKAFNWSTSINVSLPQNKLLEFDGIENTSYNSVYTVGESLSRKTGYNYLGVDRQTGVFQFEDVDANGLLNNNDFILFGNTDPDYFGGINNSLSYKGWALDFFFEFKKQLGTNALNSVYLSSPGTAFNLPEFMEERWRKAGDQATIQKVSASSSSMATRANVNFTRSNGIYSDASYIRLKNVNLSYSLPDQLREKLHLSQAMFYLQGQNLVTITGYKFSDPETQQLMVLPPLQTFVLGLKVSL